MHSFWTQKYRQQSMNNGMVTPVISEPVKIQIILKASEKHYVITTKCRGFIKFTAGDRLAPRSNLQNSAKLICRVITRRARPIKPGRFTYSPQVNLNNNHNEHSKKRTFIWPLIQTRNSCQSKKTWAVHIFTSTGIKRKQQDNKHPIPIPTLTRSSWIHP